MQDDPMFEEEQEEGESRIKAWLEDNLRIILSILVVLAVAGGIYSYSQRSQAPALTEVTEKSEDSSSTMSPGEDNAALEQEDTDTTADTTNQQTDSSGKAEGETSGSTEQKPAMETTPTPSQETEGSFIETAARGDGTTHLARRALADYLEKNPDSALSKEQKIYIEDYLRKHVGYKGHVRIGTSVEFSKSLIQESIGKSKQLNDRQLANLKKYTARVSSL